MWHIFKKNNKYSNFREIKSKEEAMIFQEEKYKDYCDEYHNANKKSNKRMFDIQQFAEEYLGNGSLSLNMYLNSRQVNDFDPTYEYNKDLLNELIMNAPKLDEDIIVYRTIDIQEFNLIKEECKQNKRFEKLSFMSTTLLLDVAKDKWKKNNSYILKIYVPKGSQVLGVDYVDNLKNEEEMLFSTNQILRYIRKRHNLYEFEIIN